MSLRPSLNLPWNDFVAQWCLGVQPLETEVAVRSALEALERFWPERLDQLEQSPSRGILFTAGAIQLGSVLARCALLQGFGAVLARTKQGERSALSELEFAAALVRLGITPSLEPGLNGKRLDARFCFEDTDVFAEVVAPDRSDAMVEADSLIGDLAGRLREDNRGAEIEVLLAPSFSTESLDTLERAIHAAPFNAAPRELPGLGTYMKTGPPISRVVSPRILSQTRGPVLGCARSLVEQSGPVALALVRLPIDDARAQRVLAAELHHFSREHYNLLVMDVTRVIGGIGSWRPLLGRCLQPDRNRRIGAVILFENYSRLAGGVFQRWHVLPNQHALRPIPLRLLDLIASMDQPHDP